jgi:hypothetical protein
MSMLRALVLSVVACAVAAAPAVAAEKAKKKHHHVIHGVIEKVEHKEHKIVIKVHHHESGTQAAGTTQPAKKRGTKKKAAHTEVTIHVGPETKIHVHDGKHKHNGSFASLKDGEHVAVVVAKGHEARDIEVQHAKK